MAEAAVTILMGNISELEIYHADLISGAEKELQQLKNDLAVLKAFLQDEAADTPELREIKTQIKELVYEVEDTIESGLSLATTTAIKISKKLFNSRDVSLAKEVKLLREGKVEELLNKVKTYSSRSIASDATSRRRWIRPAVVRAITNDKVVVLEDEVNNIIEYLIEPKEKLDVISIIGMVGLGKTTLAKTIYESKRIASEFKTRIWVHLSRKSQRRDVCLTILKSFTGRDMSSLDEKELVDTVESLLKGKKFLLVVDDVCSSDQWEAAMQPILPRSNGMGKVLITSRESHVSDGKTHKLRFLHQEESWELLQLQVFGSSGGCPEELGEVGKSIAAQCQLPLQIRVLGRVLSDQLKEKEWRKVSENGDLFLNSEKGMLNLVELSCSGLPDEFRECFLYMGVFPEDFEISVWTLIRLWIAEGLVQPINKKRLEEIAVESLHDLISRNLVMADKVNFDGEVKTCRLHDMIRKFCLAKSMEQNLFHEIKDSGVVEMQNPHHRLFSHQHPPNLLSAGNAINGLQTRSFLYFYDKHVELKLEHIPNGFPRLRILEFNSIKFRDFPAKLTRLIHLRYLTLYIDGLKTLPELLSRLWNLQTLVVETKSGSIEMKANIWKMIQLRHLKTDAAISLSSKGEGVTLATGEKLQTLDKLSPQSCTEDLFKRASKLKRLGIRGKLDTHSGHMFLEKLTSLEKLKLVNDLCDEIAAKNMLARVLQPKFLPPYLKRLTLSNTFLEWKHISTFATIESLEVLKLKRNAFIGTHWSVSDDCFPNLQFLLIADTNLVQWEASDNCFLSLKCLVLKDCEKLNEIPKALAKTLEVLDIVYVSKSAVESARKIEEEEKKQPFKLSIGLGC